MQGYIVYKCTKCDEGLDLKTSYELAQKAKAEHLEKRGEPLDVRSLWVRAVGKFRETHECAKGPRRLI